MLSVSAFDDPSSFADPNYQSDADATLAIAAEYGVLANDFGTNLAVTNHDAKSVYGADVIVNSDGSLIYNPTDLDVFRSLALGETLVDTFTYSVSGGGVSDGLFRIEAFQLAPLAQANDHDLDSASEALTIWNAFDVGSIAPGLFTFGSKVYYVSRYDSDLEASVNFGSSGGTTGGAGRFLPNLGYEAIHGDGPGGSAGSLVGGEDFSVRARTFMTFDVAGTYTLAVGSDDGRRIALSYADGAPVPFQTAGGQLTGFQPGDSVIRFEGTTGHLWSLGVFSVNAGDVVALDAFFFERTAADSFEIAIKPGVDTFFGGGTDGFELLADGVFGNTIHLSSTLAPPVPETDSATVSIQVHGVNDRPTAFNARLTVGEDDVMTALFVANDPDSDGHPGTLSYTVTSEAPTLGLLINNDDGTFTFDTAGDFNHLAVGSTVDVAFTFVATDQHGATSDPATVVIQVRGVNDAPVAFHENLTIGEDDVVTALFAAEDPDSDGVPSTLSYTVTSTAQTLGELKNNGNGTFTFDTAGKFNDLAVGSTVDVAFTFAVTDQHGATSAAATVVIHVGGRNDAPVVVSPVSEVAVNQNSASTTIALAGRFSDPDAGDTLSYAAASSNGKLVQAAVVGDQLVLTYQPNASGLTNVTVTATDRWGASVAQSFAVQVRSPRDQVNIMITQLGELRNSGVLNAGESNALEKKLLEGLKQLEKPQLNAGINTVQAFCNQIRAFMRSGRLSSSEGNKLIDWANDLINSVGG